ncbi:MAG TPA: hypothetical protein VG125_28110, partial [Pirellulales bacterium]|nr:hypothetical protein [Pirellulales bacterium]
IFAAGIFAAQGSPSRLYAFPLPTSSLVAWHLLPAMAAMMLESVVSTTALNTVFDLGWPVLGPALFAAVAVAAFASVLWLTEKSGWLFVALLVVPSALGIWLKSRYGEAFSPPTRLWTEVTPTEFATMLAVVVLAYCAAVAGVSRNRCGEPLPSLGILAWLDRLLDPAPYAGLPFRSAAEGQFWFEWRKKGWAMPAAVVVPLILGASIWLIASRNPQELLQMLFFGGGCLLSGVGIVGGLILGNCGPDDASYEMGGFLATRPLTNTDMARTILKTAAKSVFMACAIWIAACLALYLILLAFQVTPRPALPAQLGWWYFPATLIGAWTVTGLLTTAGLTGRSRPFVIFLCGLFTLWIGLILLSKFALSRVAQEQLAHGACVAGGIAFVLATAWAMVASHRRALIGWPTVYVAASFWAALSALIAVADVVHASHRIPLYLLLVGISALAVAPLATAPLALAWNRTR